MRISDWSSDVCSSDLSKKRNPALPDVPTFAELGMPIYASSRYGLMAPAGTPRPIIERLNREANEALKSDKKVLALMADYGAEIGGGTPEEFGAFMASETKRYESIVKDRKSTRLNSSH